MTRSAAAHSRRGRSAGRPVVTVKAVALVALLLLACVSVPFAWHPIKTWMLVRDVRSRYQQTRCTVVSKEVQSQVATRARRYISGGFRYRGQRKVTLYTPRVEFRHSLGGREYVSTTYSPTPLIEPDKATVDRVLARYEPGGDCVCWYDPERPERAFLERPDSKEDSP